MGRFCFLKVVLVLALLVLLPLSHGFSRKVMETFEFADSSGQFEETAGNSREVLELDYELDPKPNTNPKTGYIYSPPPPQAV